MTRRTPAAPDAAQTTTASFLAPKRSKYGVDQSPGGKAARTVNGKKFDSLAEARRYQTLVMLERAGEITDLHCQVSYPCEVDGVLVCRYVADFVYRRVAGDALVVEDVKSAPTKTPAYRLKKKLMLACHDILIVEVTA